MIWDSTLLMATIDAVIVLGALTVLCVSFRHRATISRMQVSRSAYSIAAGTCIIAALYLADLYVMLILPLYTAHDVAVAAMRHLHLNWSWIAVLAGLSCIVAGLIPLLAKLFPRIEGIIGSLEMEVAERKRAETRLQEAHDRQESRVDERTKELREINQRLVREIAERVRSEKINTRLGRIVEDAVNEIYVFDGDTLRFIQVNRGARENLGYSIEELRGLTPLELKPEHTAESFAVLLQPLRDGSADQIAFNTVHRRKDGTSYDVEVRLQLARGESSPAFFAVIQDITEQKRAEAALRQSEASLVNAQRIANLGNWDWNIVTGDLHWSDQIYRIFGLEPQQFGATYEAFLQSVHPDDREAVQAAVERALDQREPYTIDHRIVRPDGEERIVHEQGEVVFDEAGNATHMTGTVQDITEQKRAEEALRDSEARFRDFAEGANDWIWEMDADYRYIYISSAHEQHSGVPAESIIGHTRPELYARILPKMDAQKVERWQEFNRLLEAKQTFRSFEQKWIRPDGEVRYFLANGKPVFDARGKFVGYRGVGSDITELKRRDERLREELERRVEERTAELRAAQEELLRQERLVTLGQLTATVSHELRNPLGVIRTSAFTLRGGLNPEAPRALRALERVERSVIRCDRIIDELLDFTRISELEPESTALDDWLDGVLEEQALPAGVVLRRDFGLPGAAVSFDHDRFRRAVINVFDNACQAMLGEHVAKAAPGERVLTVRTQARDGRVEVIFEDQGPGIPVEIHERIFEPLFSTKGFGVGLGLPVVKRIMERHGGGIEIESEQGRGTTVRLWLDSEGNHPEADREGAAA